MHFLCTLCPGLSYSARAAVTEYHRRGLKHQAFISQFWGLEVLRSRSQQIDTQQKPAPWPVDGHLLLSSLVQAPGEISPS